MLTDEAAKLKQFGYVPASFIADDEIARRVLNFLEQGLDGKNFDEVLNNLRTQDPYMVMADFADYRRAQANVSRVYTDKQLFARMSLANIASSGIFSADRSVRDYARDIWHMKPVK